MLCLGHYLTCSLHTLYKILNTLFPFLETSGKTKKHHHFPLLLLFKEWYQFDPDDALFLQFINRSTWKLSFQEVKEIFWSAFFEVVYVGLFYGHMWLCACCRSKIGTIRKGFKRKNSQKIWWLVSESRRPSIFQMALSRMNSSVLFHSGC